MTNKKATHEIVLRADGAARGNPGPAGIGCVIEDGGGITLERISRYIGEATNNVAEYTAVMFGLLEAKKFQGRTIKVISDSELVIRQLRGEYRVKNRNLKIAYGAVMKELAFYDRASFEHVTRSRNAIADELANSAIDEYFSGASREVVDPESLWGQGRLL